MPGDPSPLIRWLCLALAAAITAQLFYLGSKPVAVGLVPVPWDKLAHLAVYSAITALLWVATAGRIPLTVIALVVAIGVLDELWQSALPGRSADLLDLVADAFAVVGTGAAARLYERSRTRDP